MCFDIRELLGLRDLASNIEEMRQRTKATLRKDNGRTHTFKVQKPYCCPGGPLVRAALEPYGVKIIALGTDRTVNISVANFAQLARIEIKRMENIRYGPGSVMFLPLAIQCDVTVKEAQAVWAEYLLERTLRMCVIGGRINGKNRDWANQHGGAMPKPWIERDCSEGHQIWAQLNKIEKEQQKKWKTKIAQP